jgi:hypothetical protein
MLLSLQALCRKFLLALNSKILVPFMPISIYISSVTTLYLNITPMHGPFLISQSNVTYLTNNVAFRKFLLPTFIFYLEK